MLQGLLPRGENSQEDLQARFLVGRLCEIRMLFYVGKDLERWLDQCQEMAVRDPELTAAGVNVSSFTQLLVEHPPSSVREKLSKWGVADYRSIFVRSLGLRAIFQELPTADLLGSSFIRYYYRYADNLYNTRLALEQFTQLPPEQFPFELFASGEYSRMLEREWETI